ncbi:adenosine 5'-monophosphoramidase HINT3-like [Cylas formicarius]|uniref:adenosine 5'-monophosphoramidase HINT3-like n=1 Tax=Cylas formicarius TaxID=197179 RepID=UPI00295868AF|nr:adenosine 5'-monophosphoramidase HINT3-like [Cylas formicarius]
MSPNCIFCKIINRESPADIQFENEEVIVFKDIKPAAKHHFLSVPKEHIVNVNSLSTKDHKNLLNRLIEHGKRTVGDSGGDVQDLRLGFHLPPFNSVSHLHLHVISPASQMSILSRVIFKPNTWWFASVEQIGEKLDVLQINNQEGKL